MKAETGTPKLAADQEPQEEPALPTSQPQTSSMELPAGGAPQSSELGQRAPTQSGAGLQETGQLTRARLPRSPPGCSLLCSETSMAPMSLRAEPNPRQPTRPCTLWPIPHHHPPLLPSSPHSLCSSHSAFPSMVGTVLPQGLRADWAPHPRSLWLPPSPPQAFA